MLYKQAELFENMEEIESKRPRKWRGLILKESVNLPSNTTHSTGQTPTVAHFNPVYTGNRVAYSLPPERD